MTINEFLEKWGRTLFEAPLAVPRSLSAREEPPELAEIRLAVLDQVRQKSYRSGGRKVFPYDLVRVEMRGLEESTYAVFAGRFFRKYLEQEIHDALRDAGCRFLENLRVEVRASVGLPQRGENWLMVQVDSQAGTSRPIAKLVVREGTANAPEVRLEKARTNIGRVVDVYRAAGLFRRNDLAFAAETEINRSVSREHAHIQFDRATGEYRLFNDRWYPSALARIYPVLLAKSDPPKPRERAVWRGAAPCFGARQMLLGARRRRPGRLDRSPTHTAARGK